jgi:ABC-2 type transport system ATP-binding protein
MQAAPRPSHDGAIPPVVVDGVSKTFQLPTEHVHTLKERFLHPLRRPGNEALHALRDVSFAVAPGEFFGIVGRNGSGKSTLLKCLAGIYGVDRGQIYVNGRMSTFIELGVGFNPDLPARDNVMLNGTMLGLSPREARRRFDKVIEFAELEDFLELKLKNYSSGMMVRLAFSVMIQVDAEILLIDEVLAVGDAAFQQKCFDEFERIRRSGATVLLVTHDMTAVHRFCDRALLLEHGRMVDIGDPEHIGNRYLQLNFSLEARAEQASEQPSDSPSVASKEETAAAAAGGDAEEPESERMGDGRAEILEAWFEDEDGQRQDVLATGRPCAFAARVRFNDEVTDPLFGVNVQNSRRDVLLSASNAFDREGSGRFAAGDVVTFRVRFENVMAPDRYHATPAVARAGGGAAWIDRRERFASVMITGTRQTDALVDPPYEVAIERAAPAGEPAAPVST